VPIRPRLPMSPAPLLCAALLVLGLILPITASASPDPLDPTAENASRAEEQATRAAERASRAEERAARARERRAMHAEEQAIRARERAAQRGARRRSAHGQPAEPGTPASETGASASPTDSSAHSTDRSVRTCHVSIHASSRRITVGAAVTLVGKLTCPAGVSAAAREVAVYQRPLGAGASGFSVVGRATTEADGSYKLTSDPFDTNTMFRVREGEHGAHTAVRVAPVVTLSGPTPAVQASHAAGSERYGQRIKSTFTGSVSPAGMGKRVALQISYAAAGERWHTVAFGRVGADGRYSITHGFRLAGVMTIRSVAHTGTQNVAAVSETLSFAAPQPQNPRLTIQTSANPISFGQSVTINGVAAGAASAPITLLARTQGSAFAIVAKATTDEAGNYTFTQAPTQNTSYRVTDAATSSTVLFEAVKSLLVADLAPDAGLSGQTVQSGQQLTFSGTLTPAHAGQAVYLEREYANGLGYHVVEVGSVNGTSGYTIVHTFNGIGANVLRIRVPSDGEHQVSTSAPFTVTVTH
jgi:hypothetical protein